MPYAHIAATQPSTSAAQVASHWLEGGAAALFVDADNARVAAINTRYTSTRSRPEKIRARDGRVTFKCARSRAPKV